VKPQQLFGGIVASPALGLGRCPTRATHPVVCFIRRRSEICGHPSATILELALQMAELGIQPRSRVRFAFWGAEEEGLLGSEHCVATLPKSERKNIALNPNFDMVASPNYVRFVHDGDGSATPLAGPTGSARIEDIFNDYFASQGLPTDPTAFDGRSDYGPFIAVGIPAGGLFTGAEGIKTAEQEAVYGRVAGAAHDPCYHLACDSLHPTYTPKQAALYAQLAEDDDLVGNINPDALDEMSDAAAHAAHAALTLAMTTPAVSGTGRGPERAAEAVATDYRGNYLRR